MMVDALRRYLDTLHAKSRTREANIEHTRYRDEDEGKEEKN